MNDRIKIVLNQERVLTDRLFALSLDYHFYYNNKPQDQIIFNKRDNVRHRIKMLFIAFKESLDLHDSIAEQFNSFISDGDTEMLRANENVTLNLTFKLECLVYNICTLYDYFGGFLYAISTEDLQGKETWKSAYVDIVTTLESKIDTSAKTKFQDINNKFVKPLFNFRADLIHYSPNFIKVSCDAKTGVLTLNVPKPLFRFLSRSNNLEVESLSFEEAVVLLMERTIEYITNLLYTYKEFFILNQRISPPEYFGYIDKETGIAYSPSSNWWH